MSQAYILVRNLKSRAERLDFGEFTISRVGLRYQELRELFSSGDVSQDDWIFEKSYDSLIGGIPNDTEDTLLLLRLWKSGDLSFVRQALVLPSGDKQILVPYRAINDLNSYSLLPFEIDPEACGSLKAFAANVQQSPSWRAAWFTAAKRFFLSGGAKPLNQQWDDVDRIVDYATALEATLVPEKDFVGRRLRRRAAALVAPDDQEESGAILKLMKRLYDLRSTIVHGSRLGDDNRRWLGEIENCRQIERRVRQVLVAAVQTLPPTDNDRRVALAALYDPTDEDRSDFAFNKCREIKAQEVRKAFADRVAQWVEES